MEEKKGARDVYRQHLKGVPFEIETDLGVVYQDSRGMYMVNRPGPGEIPKIFVVAETHPAAFELTTIALWDHGTRIRTHYDKKDRITGEYLDPPSIEAMVSVDIKDPLKEPRIHMNVPGNYESLENYRQEVVEGIHDSWVDPLSPKWTYTYSERFFNYNPSVDLTRADRGFLLPRGVNQIQKVVQDLKRDITSKGAQATTWMPTADPGLESNRPCLQRVWFRAYELGDGSIGLNENIYFRSRDREAWFMNGVALIGVGVKVADDLSAEIGRPVHLKRVNDSSDSLHFYGKDQKRIEGLLKRMRSDKDFALRTIRTNVAETDQEQMYQEAIAAEKKRLEVNPHYNLNTDSQRALAQKIAKDPNASERDKKFVRDFFPDFLATKRSGWSEDHEHFMS
jgi:thymidylate synthase